MCLVSWCGHVQFRETGIHILKSEPDPVLQNAENSNTNPTKTKVFFICKNKFYFFLLKSK